LSKTNSALSIFFTGASFRDLNFGYPKGKREVFAARFLWNLKRPPLGKKGRLLNARKPKKCHRRLPFLKKGFLALSAFASVYDLLARKTDIAQRREKLWMNLVWA
jgi:hypothetical protein